MVQAYRIFDGLPTNRARPRFFCAAMYMKWISAIVLALTILLILIHISSLRLETSDQILCYYFILIGIIDIYMNHIHDRVLT